MQDRIKNLIKSLEYRKYPISKGLNNNEIEYINSKLKSPLPKECSDLLLSFDWPDDGVDIEPIVIEENPLIGEIVFTSFTPGLKLPEKTIECQENLHWWKVLQPEDFIRKDGPIKPTIYDENRIFFSYGYDIYWFIDLNPENGGNIGQIALLYPMYQEHYIKVVAPSMMDFIEMFARKLGL